MGATDFAYKNIPWLKSFLISFISKSFRNSKIIFAVDKKCFAVTLAVNVEWRMSCNYSRKSFAKNIYIWLFSFNDVYRPMFINFVSFRTFHIIFQRKPACCKRQAVHVENNIFHVIQTRLEIMVMCVIEIWININLCTNTLLAYIYLHTTALATYIRWFWLRQFFMLNGIIK